MQETEVIVERVKQISKDYQHIEVAVDESLLGIKPGQSLLARPDLNIWHPYLRERWWPVSRRDGRLVIERPMSEHYDTGQIINVIGLIGQPYRFRRTLRNVLLLAYDTPPTPLLMTIPWLLGNDVSVTLTLLGSARKYETRHISEEVEVVLGEDGKTPEEKFNWPDQVMTVGWADQVFAVVEPGDEMVQFKQLLEIFQERRNGVPQNYLFGVFQPLLPCGTGACVACMIGIRKGTFLACSDGPALDLMQVTF